MRLDDVSWERFEQLSACLGETRALRLTYIKGSLEIMSPISDEHEALKSNLAVLVEAYMEQAGLRFYRRGGFTLREPGVGAGEPDESYCIGANQAVPDLVIEVVVTSGALSKLPLYLAKGVTEVWVWEDGRLTVHVRGTGHYVASATSQLLPGLDLALLAGFVGMADQYDAVRAFRTALG